MQRVMRVLGGIAACAGLLACGTPPGNGPADLPVELRAGATMVFDRGYISQSGIPGWNISQFRGIRVVDLAPSGSQWVITLTEEWLSATTYTSIRGTGLVLSNPGGGSGGTFVFRSTDDGANWSPVRLPEGAFSDGPLALLGWHIHRRGWSLVGYDGNVYRLRLFEAGAAARVAEPAYDSTRLLLAPRVAGDWLGAWGQPMVIGGLAFEGYRVGSDGVLFRSLHELPLGGTPLTFQLFAAPTASADGTRWFAVAPRNQVPGVCRLSAVLDGGAAPREPVECVDDGRWSGALPLREAAAAPGAVSSGALLGWGPTAVVSFAGETWAYPLDGPLDPHGARRLGEGEAAHPWGADSRNHVDTVRPRYERAVAVRGADGALRFFDVESGGHVSELRFPPNPCAPGRPCGQTSELVWAAKLSSGQYQLVYQVDVARERGFDQHPVFYTLRAAPERIPVDAVMPPVGPRGNTPEAQATALQRACLRAYDCGLRLQAGLLTGNYSTLVACTQFFAGQSPAHPRRRAFETAPAGNCAALLAAWEARERPVVVPHSCPERCEGSTLVGCDERGAEVRFDCALAQQACGERSGLTTCVPESCEREGTVCSGTTARFCFGQEFIRSVDCAAQRLVCSPASQTGCAAAMPAAGDCLYDSTTVRQDERVRCVSDRYLTWCDDRGARRFLDCTQEGVAGCISMCPGGGTDCPDAQGRCQ